MNQLHSSRLCVFFMFVNLSGMYNCINVFVVYAECLLHTNSKTLHVVQNNVTNSI